MQLSRDMSNETGVLLLQKGDTLDIGGIELIRRNTPLRRLSEGGVWIYVNNAPL